MARRSEALQLLRLITTALFDSLCAGPEGCGMCEAHVKKALFFWFILSDSIKRQIIAEVMILNVVHLWHIRYNQSQ